MIYFSRFSCCSCMASTLSYNLSKKLAGKLHLRGAKLFVQARNLGLIYCANDYGYDPEWLPGSNKPSATIAFGANINF